MLDFVVEQVIGEINSSDFVRTVRDDAAISSPAATALYAELADVSQRSSELVTKWIRGELTRDHYEAERQPWLARREDIRQKLASLPPAAALIGLPEPLTVEAWRELPEERTDAMVVALIRRIRVRTPEHKMGFEPDLVGIDWVEDDIPAAQLWPPVEEGTCSFCCGLVDIDGPGTRLSAGIAPNGSATKALLCGECLSRLEDVLWKADPRDVDPYQCLRLFERLLERRRLHGDSNTTG